MRIDIVHVSVYQSRLDANLSMCAANLDLMNMNYHYVHPNSFLYKAKKKCNETNTKINQYLGEQ